MATIYGVDDSQPVTPIMVRDAIVKCFFDAHCQETGIVKDVEDTVNVNYCRAIVKKAFASSGGDFDHPDKKSLQDAMSWLADFSSSFRDQDQIQKHSNQVMTLVQKLK